MPAAQLHIYAVDAPRAGPLSIPPLADYRGEHVASVEWDRVYFVPVFTGKPRVTGEQAAFRPPGFE
jgi:hypothetical protein